MIVRLGLGLLGFALCIFVLLTIVHHLHLIFLADLLLLVALKIWLLGFVVLVLAGLIMTIKKAFMDFIGYFAIQARLQRRAWLNQSKQARVSRLYQQKTAYYDFFSECKRRRLLQINNRKQVELLSYTIQSEISTLKKKLPESTLKDFRRQLKSCSKQQDLDSLIKLQHQLTLYL